MINIAEATTTELVDFYNANVPADKVIKKFKDRATAEIRVNKLIADLEDLKAATGHINCPSCGAHLDVVGFDQEGDMIQCASCNHSWDVPAEIPAAPKAKKVAAPKVPVSAEEAHANRSAGVARSWTDEEVKSKRSKRHKVRVDGQEFASVRAAFEHFGLPMNEHIKFRMLLKEEEQMQAYDKMWELIEA